MSIDWQLFAERLSKAQRIVLVSHIRPDCDALGSELGMAYLLEALGKKTRIINGQATPPNLAFIDPEKRIQAVGSDVTVADASDCDAIIILDTSAWAQLGAMGEVIKTSSAKKLVVDHHVGEDDLGAEWFKDTTAEATGRLVVEMARALKLPLTAKAAMPLFAALATDTGWFRFGSTTAETLRCGADLVAAGASPSQIYNQLYEQDSLARLQLRGRIIARAVTELGGRLAHTYVRQSDFAETGAHPSDTEDVINLTLGVAGTVAAVILVELANGAFKVSFRSRDAKMDCNQIAKQFGGGGHKAAAGATIEKPFAEAQAMVLDAVRAVLG